MNPLEMVAAWHDAATALRWVTLLGALAALQTALGRLAVHHLFRDEGLLGLPILVQSAAKRRTPRLTVWLGHLTGYRATLAQLVLRCAAAVLLLLPNLEPLAYASACLLLTLLLHLWKWRHDPFGVNGNDHMQTLLWTTLALVYSGTHLGRNADLTQAGLVFLSAMVLLSYWVGGLAKIGDPVWRKGLIWVVLHGNGLLQARALSAALQQRPWAQVAAWLVILIELAAPLLLLPPTPWPAFALAGFLTFHLLNAWLLEIHDFTLTWLAFFPAVLFTATLVPTTF